MRFHEGSWRSNGHELVTSREALLSDRLRCVPKLVRGYSFRRESDTNVHDVSPHQSLPFRDLPIRQTPRCDQFRKSGTGRGPAQRQTCRRNICLFTRRDHADAEGSAGTGHDDRSCRGIHGCAERRTARVPLGELRRRAGNDLPVFLEGTCARAEDPTKQSASSSHRATRSTARLAPMLIRQSRERIDVS